MIKRYDGAFKSNRVVFNINEANIGVAMPNSDNDNNNEYLGILAATIKRQFHCKAQHSQFFN